MCVCIYIFTWKVDTYIYIYIWGKRVTHTFIKAVSAVTTSLRVATSRFLPDGAVACCR